MSGIHYKTILKMDCKQKYFNQGAFDTGKLLSADDRKLLMDKYEVDESYLSHLFSGKRKAQRGKGAEIVDFAKKLADINNQKLQLT